METLLRHIAACNNARLPGTRLPFRIGAEQVGWVLPPLADALADFPAIRRDPAAATLAADAAADLPAIARALSARGLMRWRGEAFDVRATPTGPVLSTIDRGALPAFGIEAQGVHLDGLVRRANGPHIWIARRARDKALDPGKFDHIVAGGIPAGLGPEETLVKEAAEEAAMPASLARRAVPTGTIRYAMERPEGLRRDLLHCYEVELPEDFIPHATDGEVEIVRTVATGPRLRRRLFRQRLQVQRQRRARAAVPAPRPHHRHRGRARASGAGSTGRAAVAAASVVRRRRGDRDVPRLALARRLIAIADRRLAIQIVPVAIALVALLLPTAMPAARTTALAVAMAAALLLCRLVHGVDDAEVMLGVLEIALRHHPVAAARGIAPELQILLEQLLRGAPHPQVRTAAVEDVIAVQRDIAAVVADRASAATPSAAAAATTSKIPSACAFHVHQLTEALSCLPAALGGAMAPPPGHSWPSA